MTTLYRIWDLPTRLFHWLLALSVLGLVVTGNVGGLWMDWHFRFGYAVLCLLIFRLLWGFVGGYWSRFGAFIFGPSALWQYLRGRSPLLHRVGHSPLAALSVFALLLALFVQVLTGLLSDDEIFHRGPWAVWAPYDWIETASRYHKQVGKFVVMGLVALHLLALVFYKVVKRQALVQAMVTGDKALEANVPTSLDAAPQRLMALLVFALSVAATYGLVNLSL
jgi:cytochrome b